MSAERLEALYESLEDVRATQDGAWYSQHRIPRTQEDYDSFNGWIKDLEREEDGILSEIEALGGEDPDL